MVMHRVAGAPLDFAALRLELGVPGDFARAVLAEADSAGAAARSAHGLSTSQIEDATDIPLVTVDPPGSRDLDQAVHIARTGSGYLVSYAIADVAAFVRPGSELDVESRRRGQTLYFPDARIPQLPPSLSEGAASLLPGEVRPSALWQISLDAEGGVTQIQVRRARVQSREQWDYASVQRALEENRLPDALTSLAEVGQLRQAASRARHAINIDLPEQEVERVDGQWSLRIRAQLPVEDYNAEISLLTGMCAAQLMLAGGVGILRTLPPAQPGAVASLQRIARMLGIRWPSGAAPGDVLAGLDRANPHHVAFVEHAGSLLRGAAYTPFDGVAPEQPLHAGIAAPYAHVTAPLRRLVDRFGTEVCLALSAGQAVPDWARSSLGDVASAMASSDHLAHEVDRAVVDATEAWLLQDRVGEVFTALVLDAEESSAAVLLDDPAVRARCSGHHLPEGERINARLVEADLVTRKVRFERTD
jgi:exoribonuclease R